MAILDEMEEKDPYNVPSRMAPFAKAFGNLLDLNCGVILLPVCRTFIRYLYDLSTQSQETSQRVLRSFLKFVPLDKSLEFHRSIAWWVLICAYGHTFFHLVNYGYVQSYQVQIRTVISRGIECRPKQLWICLV